MLFQETQALPFVNQVVLVLHSLSSCFVSCFSFALIRCGVRCFVLIILLPMKTNLLNIHERRPQFFGINRCPSGQLKKREQDARVCVY